MHALNIVVVYRMVESLLFLVDNWNGGMLYGGWSHGVV